MEAKDADAVAQLDTAAFGMSRSKLIAGFAKSSAGLVLEQEGHINAFAFCHPFGRGFLVGPVVARSEADAIAVMEQHFKAHDGQIVRIDTQFSEGAILDCLESVNLKAFGTFITMWKGNRV